MKIQVTLSDEMLSKVDFYARKIGVSRSSLCAVFISQCIINYGNMSNRGFVGLLNLIIDEIQSKIEPNVDSFTGEPCDNWVVDMSNDIYGECIGILVSYRDKLVL